MNEDKSLSYLTGFSLNVNYIQTLKKEINFSNEITLKMHIRNYSIVTNVNEVDRYLNSRVTKVVVHHNKLLTQ